MRPSPGFLLRLVLIAFLALLAFTVWQVFKPVRSEQIVLRVSSGDSAAGIAARLEEQGIIESRFLFKTLAKLRRTDRRLMAGTYTLGGKASLYQTLSVLEKGNTSSVRVTIPEGLSLRRTLQRIEQSGLAGYDELLAAATDTAFVREQTGYKVPSLEGFLYPETYLFDLSLGPREILALMTREFFTKNRAVGIDPHAIAGFYDKLILASIVEKESAHPQERGIVASVMQNRLNHGMHLASCATVDYILERRNIKRPVLTLADTQIPSPYNTYINTSLPPGPICNPSLSSIQAALNPAKTKYLYFVADRKGRNDFSTTAEEHYRKTRKYRRAEWE
ncbi:MAG: endolytic transglycosylase MltG [Candidatus Syntrophosphaera sp.]|nr:endolytic transglycosylase MltG [Candidatus Syntrophosphaera sp.]